MRRSTLIIAATCPALALALCLTVLPRPVSGDLVASAPAVPTYAPEVLLRAPSQGAASAREAAPERTNRREQTAAERSPQVPDAAPVAEQAPRATVEAAPQAATPPRAAPKEVVAHADLALPARAPSRREPPAAAPERDRPAWQVSRGPIERAIRDRPERKPEPPPAPEPAVFATIEELALTTPSATPVYIGFHEASYPVALALVPHGHQARNDNAGKAAHVHEGPGPAFTVMTSRGRPHPATSAVDVVLAPGDPVLSVVSGTVAEVRPYLLYGKYPDNRIEIIPAGRPDLRVTMIHMIGVNVVAGQELVAGETVIAGGANQFPFLSHIDGYIDGQRHAHVHVEVKRAG